MESLLANFDPDNILNFWKTYPSWKTPELFHKLYLEDKSKDKKASSTVMWGIVHMFDKSESNAYRTLDSIERVEVINDDIMNDSKFDWKPYDELIKFSEKIMMTEEERTYHTFILYMENRRRFLEEQQASLTFDTLKQLDEAIKRNVDIMKEIDRLKAAVELKSDVGAVKGDRTESFGERNLI